MNRDYEVYAESIAKESIRRQQILYRIGKPNAQPAMEWEEFPEEMRRLYTSIVRSMIEDGEIIPGPNYSKPDPHEAMDLLKKELLKNGLAVRLSVFTGEKKFQDLKFLTCGTYNDDTIQEREVLSMFRNIRQTMRREGEQ